MPELPDLQIYAKNLRPLICGRRITSAELFPGAKVNVPAEFLTSALVGGAIGDIERDGKELHFRLDNGHFFAVHLMLHGRFDYYENSKKKELRGKRLLIKFEEGNSLALSDVTAMCRISLDPPKSTVPDVFSDSFTFDYFLRMAHKNQRANIKEFLVNQKIMRGIGNAYADEILHRTNISPVSVVGKVPSGILRQLYGDIGGVLNDAIAALDELLGDAINGEERSFLKVHNKEKTHTDDGDEIVVKMIGSKKTYYTKKQRPYF